MANLFNQTIFGGAGAEEKLDIGDIKLTAQTLSSPEWLECNGQYVEYTDYPTLWNRLRTPPKIAWTSKATNISNPVSMCYGNGYYVAISGDDHVWYRTENTSWQMSNVSIGYDGGDVAYGNGYFVICSSGGTNKGVLITTNPSSTWSKVNDDYSYMVCYFNNKFYYASYSGSKFTIYELVPSTGTKTSVFSRNDRIESLIANSSYIVCITNTPSYETKRTYIGVPFTEITEAASTVNVLGTGIDENNFYMAYGDNSYNTEYVIRKLNLTTKTFTDTRIDYFGLQYLITFTLSSANNILFLSQNSKTYSFSDITAGTLIEHANYASISPIIYDGTNYISLGNLMEYSSKATDNSKQLPTIPQNFGVSAYIKASEV